MQFSTPEKLLLAGAPGANSPSLAALDSPLGDGAFGKTGNFDVLPKAPSQRELAKPSGFD